MPFVVEVPEAVAHAQGSVERAEAVQVPHVALMDVHRGSELCRAGPRLVHELSRQIYAHDRQTCLRKSEGMPACATGDIEHARAFAEQTHQETHFCLCCRRRDCSGPELESYAAEEFLEIVHVRPSGVRSTIERDRAGRGATVGERATLNSPPINSALQEGEHFAALTKDFWLVQRVRGHRYSVDDLLVAHAASTRGSGAKRVLDLGCGIGSVMLMVAWALPGTELIGLEAQRESAELARRNVELNGLQDRVRVVEGDLRDEVLVASLGRFELVTGTPPYFDPKKATPCQDPQRAHAKFELRGGIEEYAQAAARVLEDGGWFVACATSNPPGRTRLAVEKAGLHLRWFRQGLRRSDRGPFLDLFGATRVEGDLELPAALVLREEDGRRSQEHAAIREFFGLAASEY